MSKFVSPYYPPRAKWYRFVFQLGSIVRRRAYLDRLHLPDGISPGAIFRSIWWPGIGFYVRGEKLIGTMIMCASTLLLGVFIVWLGYPAAHAAFGLFLSAHVTSLIFLCSPWLAGVSFRVRIGFTILALSVLGLCVYLPLRKLFHEHCLMPLRANGCVVVAQRMTSANSIQRGDWIAYTLPLGREMTAVRVREGLGLGPVLATGGDHVRFLTNGFAINGVLRPPLPHMPREGELVVPEKHWFVWPELAITANGNVGEAPISATMLQLAVISESEFLGKPFKRWFWREQLFP
jgi:hypothetical protein